VSTTTIQISTRNRDELVKLGQRMQAEHPGIWQAAPSYDQVVGYALWMAGSPSESFPTAHDHEKDRCS
jgi:hypothetical protein